jgi:integrase
VRDLAKVWLKQIKDSDLASGTKDTYERSLSNHVVKALGGLQMREVDVETVDSFLAAIQGHHGASAAKTAKSVTSLLFGLAARYGAIAANPVRSVSKIKSDKPREKPRALTPDEEKTLRAKVVGEPLATKQDVADLMKVMLGTGMRVGECLGIRRQVVDLEASVIEVNATAVFVKGKGGVLQERTKSDAGWRVIAVPDDIMELCRKRLAMSWPENEHGLLFPTSLGDVRLPSNADRAIRTVLDRIGFEWVVPHTFRKTVATRLDDAGLSARMIADHLGHAKPSMTMDVYLGRKVVSSEAAKILETEDTRPAHQSRGGSPPMRGDDAATVAFGWQTMDPCQRH